MYYRFQRWGLMLVALLAAGCEPAAPAPPPSRPDPLQGFAAALLLRSEDYEALGLVEELRLKPGFQVTEIQHIQDLSGTSDRRMRQFRYYLDRTHKSNLSFDLWVCDSEKVARDQFLGLAVDSSGTPASIRSSLGEDSALKGGSTAENTWVALCFRSGRFVFYSDNSWKASDPRATEKREVVVKKLAPLIKSRIETLPASKP
jgi:hypothetical protein